MFTFTLKIETIGILETHCYIMTLHVLILHDL